MNTEPVTDIATSHGHVIGRKAVCYKCAYVGLQLDQTRCPVCAFPLIQECVRVGDEVCPDIASIFDRTSVSIGAPPLPGVDAQPRKAQLLAEARKRRITEQREAAAAVRRQREQVVEQQVRKVSASAVVFAFVSAVAAGVLAAVLVNGAI